MPARADQRADWIDLRRLSTFYPPRPFSILRVPTDWSGAAQPFKICRPPTPGSYQHKRGFVKADIDKDRREYLHAGLSRRDLDSDPIAQLDNWLQTAIDAGLRDATAMSLATVDANGQPSLRTVLLKFFDASGFVFYTNQESRKAREIAQNPQVALLFYWREFDRQVIITGTAHKVSIAESVRYFATRPRESRLGAWVSAQSSVISSRALLEQKFEEMKRKFADGEIPLPSFWGGYRVEPSSIEFWQGRINRLHDRFMYRLQPDGSWLIERLAP